MKHFLKHSVLLLLLFAFFMVSSGVVYYSHYCKIEQCFKGEVKLISPDSCTIEPQEESCHSNENETVDSDEDGCCETEAEFETLQQVDGSVNFFALHLPPEIRAFQFKNTSFLASRFLAKRQNKAPPFLKLNRVVQFQNYRC